MPANLSPEYKAAEKEYRRAREPRERLACLKEMLRTIPKHKGTEHLQGDIKAKIKELTDELAAPKKAGARTAPATVIRPEGAAQVALLGAPNVGKSALHARLTGSHAHAEPYPFATQFPLPGMLPVEDVTFQLVDLPSISPEHPIPWIANAVQPADGALLVVDVAHAGCVEEVVMLHEMLAERRVTLHRDWPEGRPPDDDDPFTIRLPTVLVANKADLVDDLDEELAAFRELTGYDYPALATSVETGEGLEALGAWLFDRLGVVRVYTKIPGQPPDMSRPFTVRRGDTVLDVAFLVHKDIGNGFKYARLWGKEAFDGQQVGRDHVVADGDVVELHA